MSSIIADLLGELSWETFLEQFYLRLPVARTASRDSWRQMADWAVVERLMSHPQADVLAGRQGERWPGGSPTAEQIREVLSQGYTLGLRHVDRIDDSLAELAETFRQQFAAPIDIHLYCTPANQPGFGWHYDAEEVFILQTAGSKCWRLRKNTVNPWPLIDQLPADQRYEREIMPIMDCLLHAGDWLYIPGGYWHDTQADAESISLSVGVRAKTALDLFDDLRPMLANSMLWRQRLSCQHAAERKAGIMPPPLHALLDQLIEDLAVRLRAPTFIEAAIRQTLPER